MTTFDMDFLWFVRALWAYFEEPDCNRPGIVRVFEACIEPWRDRITGDHELESRFEIAELVLRRILRPGAGCGAFFDLSLRLVQHLAVYPRDDLVKEIRDCASIHLPGFSAEYVRFSLPAVA